jgi:recombination protein U
MKINELEKLANAENIKLRKDEEALILKVPVPILYTNKGMIVKQSTVDYVGIIKGGTFVAYDAKETESKTSFPLANMEQHQIEYLRFVKNLGGLAFFLIHFKNLYKDKMFITPLSLVTHYYDNKEGRRSLPIKDFNLNWLTPINTYLTKVLEMKEELLNDTISINE